MGSSASQINVDVYEPYRTLSEQYEIFAASCINDHNQPSFDASGLKAPDTNALGASVTPTSVMKMLQLVRLIAERMRYEALYGSAESTQVVVEQARLCLTNFSAAVENELIKNESSTLVQTSKDTFEPMLATVDYLMGVTKPIELCYTQLLSRWYSKRSYIYTSDLLTQWHEELDFDNPDNYKSPCIAAINKFNECIVVVQQKLKHNNFTPGIMYVAGLIDPEGTNLEFSNQASQKVYTEQFYQSALVLTACVYEFGRTNASMSTISTVTNAFAKVLNEEHFSDEKMINENNRAVRKSCLAILKTFSVQLNHTDGDSANRYKYTSTQVNVDPFKLKLLVSRTYQPLNMKEDNGVQWGYHDLTDQTLIDEGIAQQQEFNDYFFQPSALDVKVDNEAAIDSEQSSANIDVDSVRNNGQSGYGDQGTSSNQEAGVGDEWGNFDGQIDLGQAQQANTSSSKSKIVVPIVIGVVGVGAIGGAALYMKHKKDLENAPPGPETPFVQDPTQAQVQPMAQSQPQQIQQVAQPIPQPQLVAPQLQPQPMYAAPPPRPIIQPMMPAAPMMPRPMMYPMGMYGAGQQKASHVIIPIVIAFLIIAILVIVAMIVVVKKKVMNGSSKETYVFIGRGGHKRVVHV